MIKDLSIMVEEHIPPPDRQVCSCCATSLKYLEKREIHTELELIPTHLVEHTHYEYTYEFLNCKKTGKKAG